MQRLSWYLFVPLIKSYLWCLQEDIITGNLYFKQSFLYRERGLELFIWNQRGPLRDHLALTLGPTGPGLEDPPVSPISETIWSLILEPFGSKLEDQLSLTPRPSGP